MTVYHGTTLEIRNPKILEHEVGRDFGFAFYTTDIREQAERWAVRRARLDGRRFKDVRPVVNVYEWTPPDGALAVIEFQGASMEWLEMVVRCRSERDFRHKYDIVIGKIADDNVGETVSYVMQGIMRREDALKRLRFEKINNQIAFCSGRALQTLHFVRSYAVE